MPVTFTQAFWRNFLGHAPDWYKGLIIGCLAANPVLLALSGPVVTSWAMLFEFIVTLMMALRCYPLQPGGLIAIEAALLGLVTPAGIQQEIETGLPIILLLMFMVAGIFFLREMLVFTFTRLLVVFFAIVGVINQQQLFRPFLDWVLQLDPGAQPIALFGASGLLSAVSDNVFVATIYIGQVRDALVAGSISREQFEVMAVAINTGTNIPSIATPNGQAAFLFLLTSALAPLIRLSYFRMVWMALPYRITMTGAAALGVLYLL